MSCSFGVLEESAGKRNSEKIERKYGSAGSQPRCHHTRQPAYEWSQYRIKQSRIGRVLMTPCEPWIQLCLKL